MSTCCQHHRPHAHSLLATAPSPATGGKLAPRQRRSAEPQSESAIVPQPAALLPPGTLLGEVLSGHDPRRDGRFLVAISLNGGEQHVLAERVTGLCIKPGDRVLVVVPENVGLAVITAVVARHKPAPAEQPAAALPRAQMQAQTPAAGTDLVLRDSDSLRVTSAAGQTLLAIEQSLSGPVVRLGDGTLELDVPGELHLSADHLRLTTRSGPLEIVSQADDVIVRGQYIRLN